MSGVTDISPALERLDSQLDDLEDALKPLLGNIDEIASKLPLLDRAKMFSLTAYAIESLLFYFGASILYQADANILTPAAVKLQGTDAQNHEVYTELKRVQQYFTKIKAIEEPEGERSVTVNKEAAARVLKANLSDNKALSAKLAEKIAEERAKALLKTMDIRKRPAAGASASNSPSGSINGDHGGKVRKPKHKNKGKNKQKH